MYGKMPGPTYVAQAGKHSGRIHAARFPNRQMMKMNVAATIGRQRGRPIGIQPMILDIDIHEMQREPAQGRR